MKVRLIRKFANMINGVDLEDHRVGDILTLTAREARMLLAEGWAERHRRAKHRAPRIEVADSSRRRAWRSPKTANRS